MQYSCTHCVERTIGLEIGLEIVLVLTQDRCAVCVKHTIGSEIFWTDLMELLGDVGHVKSHFGLFGSGVGVGAI